MEEEVRIYDYCGRVLAEEEGTPVDDELLMDTAVMEEAIAEAKTLLQCEA
ncbi:MAG: hypothetical protein V8T34_00375 [Ruminococcus callidus]